MESDLETGRPAPGGIWRKNQAVSAFGTAWFAAGADRNSERKCSLGWRSWQSISISNEISTTVSVA